MSIVPRLDVRGVEQLSLDVRDESAGSFYNTLVIPGTTCATCTGPVSGDFDRCWRCQADRTTYGSDLADQVVPVVYAVDGEQSAHQMRMYKAHRLAPHGPRIRLARLLSLVLHLHGPCAEATAGHEITAWAAVPSTRGRPGEHPLRWLARAARMGDPSVELQPREVGGDARATSAERFGVEGDVRDRHVLVLDDTWVSGGHAQSASLVLKGAGAVRVTALVIARWLKPGADEKAASFARSLSSDFDPQACPVRGEGERMR